MRRQPDRGGLTEVMPCASDRRRLQPATIQATDVNLLGELFELDRHRLGVRHRNDVAGAQTLQALLRLRILHMDLLGVAAGQRHPQDVGLRINGRHLE